MKFNLKNTTLFVLALVVFSCSQEDEDLSSLKNQSLDIETFFEKVSSMDIKTSSENIIYIDYEWNAVDKTIKYFNSEEKEPDFFILENEKSLSQRVAAYQVDCDNGDNSWSKSCGGKWSCGGLIADCLDQGGCATICQQRMAYAPQTKTFYLIK